MGKAESQEQKPEGISSWKHADGHRSATRKERWMVHCGNPGAFFLSTVRAESAAAVLSSQRGALSVRESVNGRRKLSNCGCTDL